MKVSVIVEDKMVVVDGVPQEVPTDRWPTTAANIWAYQWNGSVGETESTVKGEPNTEFTNISTVQPYIDIHTTLREEAAAALAESAKEATED